MTSHNVIKDNKKGVEPITKEHVVNEVRKYLMHRGITPENLPPKEDVERIINKKESEENKKVQQNSQI